MYNFEEITQKVKENLSDFRFQHSLRVSEYAQELAKKNNYDIQKAKLAGLVHDYAKESSNEEFLFYIDKYKLDPELKKWKTPIWHGIVGAYIIKEKLGIEDEDVLHAISVHTTGDIEMTILDKILYMADWLEPGRDFSETLDAIKTKTEANLDYGIAQQLSFALDFLSRKKEAIYPKTLYAYNYWVGGIK
ncbi:MAG: bis(5'-nucleosyl)-tetraphosphatase (symmetrical) YqeK [Lactobacillaceae bacterium]|jgi:predicted HD superfamily hydrolase involved in NAD metabolism|nr:bis(5'-nucleosyl)-tetraphosphatase (symmetrical) YqeK [Lactobacillaceae bacterium]